MGNGFKILYLNLLLYKGNFIFDSEKFFNTFKYEIE